MIHSSTDATTTSDRSAFKMEHGRAVNIKDEIRIKSDPDSLAPVSGPSWEEDLYEDAGDLDFEQKAQNIYLMRIPKFLWKTWSQMEDDQEIQLGKIRIEAQVGDIRRMSLLLSSDIPVNESVPKEYNMQITNRDPANTFVFSEKDLVGYTKPKASARQTQDSASLPFSQVAPRPNFQDRSRQGAPRFEKTKKWQPYYRKAIPKKTAIAGQVRNEINCLPVENDEFRYIMDERAKQATKPKKETQIMPSHIPLNVNNVIVPGALGTNGNFGTFIKTAGASRATKAQDLKAARMPQNELLDMIGDCFKRYNYWPLKSLRTELNQPEAYLKQTLEKVAQLVRQGPHAMTWQLKPESKISAYADAHSYEHAKDEIAPDVGYGFDGPSDIGEFGDGAGTDEEDDDLKLEDVMPL